MSSLSGLAKHKSAFHTQQAVVLAAGLGRRMRPFTKTKPKPLIKVCNKALIDYSFEKLRLAGLNKVVVNAHYLADQVEYHCRNIPDLHISISDERTQLLDSGGGIKNALSHLEPHPFVLLNSDSFWIEGVKPNLLTLFESWDETKMDMLLLLSPTVGAIGYDGLGDFVMAQDGRLQRRSEKQTVPHVYAGAAIIHPCVFEHTPQGPFSLNLVFDRLIRQGRLFGVRMNGLWLHVGTPEALKAAEQAIYERCA